MTALEQERIQHINLLMDELNGLNSDIYESLCDKEYKVTRQTIIIFQKKLKALLDSMQDEI